AFDHKRVASALTEKLGKEIDAERLPFEKIEYSSDEKKIKLIGSKEAWSFNLEDYNSDSEDPAEIEQQDRTEIPREERRRNRSRAWASAKSPDEKWEVIVRGHNLFLKDLTNPAEKETPERQVTHD